MTLDSTLDLTQRRSGVVLHITSLPGPGGSGDLGAEAHRFVDWLASAGQTLWQTLPINPIGPGHSPYQCPSAFAGSGLMVSLQPLAARGWLPREALEHGPPDAASDAAPDAAANARPDRPADASSVATAATPQAALHRAAARVAYDRVIPWRWARLHQAAAGFVAHADAADRADFARWQQAQQAWLPTWTLFAALKDAHGGQPWWQWPDALARRDAGALDQARERLAPAIALHAFVQWCFDRQWAALREHAHRRNVLLMGDLPIFIAHDSADVWARPDLYWLDADTHQPTVVAGVPPDGFGSDGQRRGNPLYRWDRMADDGYGWWVARVRRAFSHADLLRIDHFRGFAGCWEVPAACATARDGRWVPGPGAALFDAIEAALGRLPIVAEDLGTITPDVIALRDHFGFPGMRIVQEAFGSDATHAFLPHQHTRNSLAYSSTHDNDTAFGWWATTDEPTRVYARGYLTCGDADMHWGLVRATSQSVACMALFTMQDVLGLDGSHRMNRPGTSQGNWAWRFDWPMVDAAIAPRLARMAAASGRGPFGALAAAGGNDAIYATDATDVTDAVYANQASSPRYPP